MFGQYLLCITQLISRIKLLTYSIDTIWFSKNVRLIFRAELDYLKPDIICFQELEDEVVTNTLTARKSWLYLVIENYASWYIYKTQNKNDCVSIFWKADKFELICSWTIEMGKDHTRSYLYCKPQVACFAALKITHHNQKRILLVATTHLLYNNNRGDIKFAQIDLITQSLALIKRYLVAKFKNYSISTILCGDFNSTSKSGIYQYMIEGKYDCSTQNRNEISGQM